MLLLQTYSCEYMATIRLQNFGPIKDTGVITLNDVTLVIGHQSSGKSAFMKVLCYCRWLEKKIMTSFEDVIPYYTHNKKFMIELMQFHRLNDLYFTADTKILYDGDVITISFPGRKMNAKILRKEDKWDGRFNTKLCYIPAERNLVSAVKNIDKSYKTTERDVLFNFILEWAEGREPYDSEHPIPLTLTADFKYYNEDEKDIIVLPNGEKITAFYASSGVQSVVPINVMSDYLLSLIGKSARFSRSDLTNVLMEILKSSDTMHKVEVNMADQRIAENFKKKMQYQSMQLFVEEPEQNLFPDAQRNVIQNLVRTIKKAKGLSAHQTSLVMTTHSPYVLSTLNVLMADAAADMQLHGDYRLAEIIDQTTLLPLSAYSAYYIDENGIFRDIKETELSMISGVDLDGVSDWVNEHIGMLNQILYADDEK